MKSFFFLIFLYRFQSTNQNCKSISKPIYNLFQINEKIKGLSLEENYVTHPNLLKFFI